MAITPLTPPITRTSVDPSSEASVSAFVTSVENFYDELSTTFVTEVNATEDNMELLEASAQTAKTDAETAATAAQTAQGLAEDAATLAVDTVATLPSGSINDTTPSLTQAYSSQKTEDLISALPVSSTEYFVTSSDVTDGKPVVLKSDGTVEQVVGWDLTVGSSSVIKSGGTVNPGIKRVVLNDGRILITYSYGGVAYYKIGTRTSETTISFSPEYTFATGYSTPSDIVLAPDGSLIFAYSKSSSRYGACRIITVDGDTLNFGSEVIFHNADAYIYHTMTIQVLTSTKFVIFYARLVGGSSPINMMAVVGTLSSGTVTFGTTSVLVTTTNIGTTNPSYITLSRLDDTRLVALYYGVSSYPRAICCSVSGTTITTGSEVTIVSAGLDYMYTISVLDTNKVLFSCGNSSNIYWAVGTISGTTISLGALFTPAGGGAAATTIVESPTSVRMIYTGIGTSNIGTTKVSISGTTVSSAEAHSVLFSSSVWPQMDRPVLLDVDTILAETNPSGTSLSAQVVNLAYTNLAPTSYLIGIADSSGIASESIPINMLGAINSKQSALSIGATYYVNKYGQLTTTSTDNVLIGKAISATKLLITKGV